MNYIINWNIYKLAEVISDFIDYRGKTPTKVASGIPLITAKVVKGGIINKPNEFVPEEIYEKWMTRGIPEYGDVVLTTEAPLGEVAQLNFKHKVVVGQRLITLRGKKELLDNTFLKYSLLTKEMQAKLVAVATGTTVSGIKSAELKKVEINLPNLATQRRIAEILSALDGKIELNNRMNQTLEQMVKTNYKIFSEAADIVPLTDLIDLNPKLTLRKGTVSQYVEMSNLSETSSSIKQSVLREYSGGAKFQNNDTLLARITPCLENGKTGFVDILAENEVGFGSTEYIVMRGKKGVSPYFGYCVARDNAFREHAIRSMTGTSGRQRVQVDMLETFALPKWSTEDMEAFHATAHAAFQKIKANTAEIKTLTTLRDTLLPKLMSGEIDVMQTKPEALHEQVLS